MYLLRPKKYKAFVLLFLFLCTFQFNHAQDQTDSLRMMLLQEPENPTLLNDLATTLIPDSIIEGRSYAEQALSIAQQSNNIEEQARALYTIGDAWWYEQNFAAAIEWFGKSALTWEQVGNLWEAAACYNEMGYSSVEIDRFDDALRYYKKSLALLLEIDDDEYIAAVIMNIARVYQGVAKYDSAIYYNQQAIALSEVPGKEVELSTALGNLGMVYKQMGNYDKALEFYERAYEIAKAAGDPALIAVDLNNIAALYAAWEKFDFAADYFNKALKIDYETGNMAQAEMTLNNLANVIQSQGYLDSALKIFHEALAISDKLGRYGNSALKRLNIGSVYHEMGQYQEAISYYTDALETCRELGLRNFAAGGLQNLGAAWLALGDFKEAEKTLDQALVAATEINARPILLKIYESQSKLYEKMGKTTLALQAYRNYSMVKDSIFTENSQAKLAEMEVRYETEKKEQQIELLVKDNQLHEAELRKKQITLIGLSAGLIFLLLAGGIITWLYLQKSRANRKLVEKNIELMQEEDEKENPVHASDLPSQLKDEEKLRILSNLEMLMRDQKLFLQVQLSLTDLADKLETNTAYLSRIINEHFNFNFSSYLNKLRVREAQKMFAEKKHLSMTLEGIAGSAGFHSRSTFNTAFKKITGVTPSVYIKNMNEIGKKHELEKSLKSKDLYE
jgi:tetratricopeptide (TPR) repeat protein